ncbi:hypothetical protein MGG_16851 [Pyricularia oryzae 70-15]|uniref:Uncharacterized protein n=4 Tax=Pyricularia oryzae TaxID=318829 RepID=G4N431_PYRO7|nr:uncharacterized protein MGG_16851 [Pyricularia oryzae 70-15]ELQ43094.1 hypothetical protein OOU_Y34scaffold00174g59 [Pyricularia oryzae Y34]KAI7925086.1 hypothetical protein M9X92_003461 [Pyricularia oryzae]EHA52751.1 hypothetical protein MGG_16851 [Pyricularia oryzae 70-15]KAI7928983.1 hypothetical protein M0657_002419 [Pyricularia oryzae]QBZ59374.1 hypothetical protein PoMZ_04335 [Pyricularia oryzae]
MGALKDYATPQKRQRSAASKPMFPFSPTQVQPSARSQDSAANKRRVAPSDGPRNMHIQTLPTT